MKRILFLATMMMATFGFGQIKVVSEQIEIPQITPITDSTKNIHNYEGNAEYYLGLIGHKIYVYPINHKSDIYKHIHPGKYVYYSSEQNKELTREEYDRLMVDKYFTIKDVKFRYRKSFKDSYQYITPEEWKNNYKKSSFDYDVELWLEGVDNSSYIATGTHFSNFLSVIYYEYLQKKYLNEQIIYKSLQYKIEDFEKIIYPPEQIRDEDIYKVSKIEIVQKNSEKDHLYPDIRFTLQDNNGNTKYIYDTYKYKTLGIDSYILVKDYTDFLNRYTDYTNNKKREKEERMKQYEEVAKKERSEKYAKLKIKYGKSVADLMIDGYVRIGWTKQMCRESWGEPETINKITTGYSVSEQWVYSLGSYLYFENGKLTAIQN